MARSRMRDSGFAAAADARQGSLTFVKRGWLKAAIVALPLFLLARGSAGAQTFQFLPEVDLYHKLTPDIRFTFQAKETREAGDPTQAEIGPSFDFYLKPIVRLKDVSALELDDSKSRPLQLAVGYRFVPSPDKPATERLELAATSHMPLVGKILMSDRSRADLDWSNGQFTWRYRNRLTLERRFAIGAFHPAPYVSAEPFYESQYNKWNTTAIYVGCLFSMHRHFEFNLYYEHQNVTSKHPNQQFNQFGLILDLYF